MLEETKKLTPEQQSLIESNIGIARMAAWKYHKICKQYGMEWDDVFSIACMGLMKAARSFDPARSKPSTYLSYGCETALLMELRRCRSVSRSTFKTVSIESVMYREENHGSSELTFADTLKSDEPTPEATVMFKISTAQAWKTIKTSTSRTQRCMLLLRMNGMKQSDIAMKLGCSQAHVSRTLARIRGCVTEALAS